MRNTTVLATVSRNELIYTVYDRQLRFLGHMLRGTYSPHARTYALYQPTHGSTRSGRPRTNYVDYIYIQKLTGLKIDELVESFEDRETWRELVIACVDPQPSDYRETHQYVLRLNMWTSYRRWSWSHYRSAGAAIASYTPCIIQGPQCWSAYTRRSYIIGLVEPIPRTDGCLSQIVKDHASLQAIFWPSNAATIWLS